MKPTIFLTLTAVCAGLLPAQEHIADTLKKAVLEEESQHNQAAATQDYQSVVAQFDEARKSAATAMYRLGEIYRQSHKDAEAKALYVRVAEQFPDQKKLADLSRGVLVSTYKLQLHAVPAKSERSPEVVVADAEVSRQLAARERYRWLLIQEIELAQGNIERLSHQADLGVVNPDAISNAKLAKLKLDRELAAFDMGIIPSEGRK